MHKVVADWLVTAKELLEQIFVDIGDNRTQYLGSMNLLIQEVGQEVGFRALNETTLQGKIVHGGNF